MNQEAIQGKHIMRDGLHLNNEGSGILKYNIQEHISQLNTFPDIPDQQQAINKKQHQQSSVPPPTVYTPSNLHPLNNSRTIPIVPGTDLYSTVVSSGQQDSIKASEKTSIFSSSITRDIKQREFNKLYKGQNAFIHKFHGGKIHHIKNYVPIHMDEDKSDNVVVLAGGNDLSGKATIPKIANDIIEAGLASKLKGASKVYIGSVLPRSDFHHQIKRHELNNLLKNLCVVNNFIYLNNDNINLREHLHYDGVHLNSTGSALLQKNLLSHLNA